MIRHWLKLVWNRRRSNALLAVEIFFSFLVLFVIAVCAVYFADNYRQPLGFAFGNVLSIRVEVNNRTGCSSCGGTWDGGGGDPDDAAKAADERLHTTQAFGRLIRTLKEMPQVDSAAAINFSPYSYSSCGTGYRLNNKAFDSGCNTGSDELARTLGIQLVSGRWFSLEDKGAQIEPLVINQRLARLFFGLSDPIGKLVQDGSDTVPKSYRVIGVMQDFRQFGELSGLGNYAFGRWDETSGGPMRSILVHIRPGTPRDFEQQAIARLQSTERDWSFQIEPLEKMRYGTLRTRLLMLGAGALVGAFLILMVGLGIVGVLWQSITRRSAEIGVRRAMGATAGAVYRQILGELLIVTSFGLMLGTLLIVQLPILQILGWVSGQVVAIAAALAAVIIYLLAVAAGLYPSWLAGRVQPAVVLRSE